MLAIYNIFCPLAQELLTMSLKMAVFVALIAALLLLYSLPRSPTAEEYQTHLKDKVVLLCGASSGIGEQLAYQLAKQGAKLVLVARTETKLVKVKQRALELGSPRVEVLPYDLSDVKNAKWVIDNTVEMFGSLDYLVLNHASMGMGMFLAFEKQQRPDFIERMFKINILSSIELTLHALPHLEASKGHVFVTSSESGELPDLFSALYCSTKHAINGFFYSLQQELLARESDVTLTVGALGFILTDDLRALLDDFLEDIPRSAIGDVEECATGMMNSLVLRPRTFTYPRLAVYLRRLTWYFNPYYHEIIAQIKLKGSYNSTVEWMSGKMQLAKELGFQQGNLGD